ncbi:methyltransferase [candidate division KSB1 bacterium]|nr:methyltransferase [candidate division KSB1 bacterium]
MDYKDTVCVRELALSWHFSKTDKAMINFKSKKYTEIEGILKSCSESGDFTDWAKFLNSEENTFTDGLINLLDLDDLNHLLCAYGFNGVNDWLIHVDSWNEQILDPRADAKPESLIMYQLWLHIESNLTKAIRNSRLVASIPRKGGILYFLGGLSKCLVIKYEIVTELPKFHIVDIIDDPKSVFDFWAILNESKLREKNILKEILSTGHKIIFHRNVLIHIDRRKDIDVFGPTIDTVLIAEILTQKLFEPGNSKIRSALEIGCGNGLITVAIAKNCNTLKSIFSIDSDFNSISCTHRNLRSNLDPFRYNNLDVFLLCASYRKNLFKTKFDLIVCNPPYIPLLSNQSGGRLTRKDYLESVGGLTLIDEILNSLKGTLSQKGKLLLLVSSLSLEYTISKLPKEFSYELPLPAGFEVLFDVEAVLNNAEWLEFLISSGGLIIKDNVYFHKLFPMWITRI